jgi:hypothetical protein
VALALFTFFWSLYLNLKMATVDQLKEEGNAQFKKDDFKAAAISYTKAIKDANFANYENKHVLYSNRSAAFLGNLVVTIKLLIR